MTTLIIWIVAVVVFSVNNSVRETNSFD